MQGKIETEFGKILIDTDVIATYAGSVAVECFGIVGMAAVNMKDGLVKLLKKDYLNHGISVLVDEENGISLDFHVIIAYGVSVQTVADNLMETVKYKVEELTGMTVSGVWIATIRSTLSSSHSFCAISVQVVVSDLESYRTTSTFFFSPSTSMPPRVSLT